MWTARVAGAVRRPALINPTRPPLLPRPACAAPSLSPLPLGATAAAALSPPALRNGWQPLERARRGAEWERNSDGANSDGRSNHADSSSRSHSAAAAAEADALVRAHLFAVKSKSRSRNMLERLRRLRGRVRLRVGGTNAAAPASPLPAPPPPAARRVSMREALGTMLHPGLLESLRARRHRLMHRNSDAHTDDNSAQHNSIDAPVHSLLHRWSRVLEHLLSLGGASSGNRVTVFRDGGEAFEAMWSAIASARSQIRMEAYILEPDGVGLKTLRLLTDAARRGVDVRLCFDSFGSWNMLHAREPLDALLAAGGQFVHFNPIWHLFVRAPWRNSLWFRNHRKLLVVDGRVAFAGGMNVSVDYHSLSPPGDPVAGTGKFRDTHMRLTGPCVADLLDVSRDTFQEALRHDEGWARWFGAGTSRAKRREREKGWYPKRSAALVASSTTTPAESVTLPIASATPSSTANDAPHVELVKESASGVETRSVPLSAGAGDAPPHLTLSSSTAATSLPSLSDHAPSCPVCSVPLPTDSPNGVSVQVLPSNVWRNKRAIQRAMLLTVRAAKRQILVTNPYFFPPRALFRALQQAADRGVKVRVIMAGAGKTDVPVTRWASQHIYASLLRRGVEIFELHSATLHAKVVVIDSLYSSVGSFNWDRLSARRNLELNVTMIDANVAAELEQHFEHDLHGCVQVTTESMAQRNIAQRILHRVAYWIMRGI